MHSHQRPHRRKCAGQQLHERPRSFGIDHHGLGSEAVSDLRFQAATRHAVLRTNKPFGPAIDIAGLVIFGRPYAGNIERRENHYQVGYTSSRTRGKHLWKVGGTVNRVRLRTDVPDGFDGVYLFGSLGDFLAGNPNQFRQGFGISNVDFPVTSLGGFVQDHWSVARQLTVDLGVRTILNACLPGSIKTPITSARELVSLGVLLLNGFFERGMEFSSTATFSRI